jgi:membrane associated rhomboid family serine protease
MKVDIQNQDIGDDKLYLQSQFNTEPNIISATQLNDDIKKSRGLKFFDMDCMTTVEYMTTEKYDNTIPSDKEVPSLPKDDLLSLSSSRQSSSDKSGVSEKEGSTLLAMDHTVTSESDIETGTATKNQGILIKSAAKKSSIKTFSTVSFASGSHQLISSKSDEAKEERSIVSESTYMTTSTFGTMYTFNTMGSETTLGVETLLKRDDAVYITQRFGFINLVLSVTQLFSLTMTLSLCGFAPIAFNYGLGPYADTLSQAGALNPYLFLEQGQYWRLFTAPLLTSSVLHFLINGFFQVEAGAFIEREWGSLRLFIIYIFSAFGATTVSCIFAPDVVSVTSSSALFGVLGAKYSEFLMVLNFRTKRNRIRRDYYIQQIKVIACISMVILSMCLFSYIEVSGVLGGFVFGFTSGMILLYPQLMKKQDKILWAGTGLSLMILLIIAVLFLLRQTNPPEEMEDVCNYYESFHYEGYNCQCLI